MLINSFMAEMALISYRLCWITGRYGSGKTSVAYMLSKGYLEKGYRLVSNNRCVWADALDDVKPFPDGKLKCIVILDEGGLMLEDNDQVKEAAAYAAKMDIIYIIPSYFAPPRAAQVMTIQAVFNFKSAGIPLVAYRWSIRMGAFNDKGFFLWWNPKEIYGIYSRSDPGARLGKIISWVAERKNEYRNIWGYDEEHSLSVVENEGREIKQFKDSIEAFTDGVDRLQALPVRKRGRR